MGMGGVNAPPSLKEAIMAKGESVKLNTEDMKWKAEGDARTLEDAELIRGDQKRLKAAMKVMDDKMNAMQNAKEANMDAMAGKMFKDMKKSD